MMCEKIVYVSTNNKISKKAGSIVKKLALRYDDCCILSPFLCFPYLRTEEFLDNCLTLLDMCDEMWVIDNDENSFSFEMEYCNKHKIPIKIIRR
ncbi:MAG: hypothetical protein J6V58_01370 [Clostridia bacterium]|nr:hypothetical protein [Clostridia bacterium]